GAEQVFNVEIRLLQGSEAVVAAHYGPLDPTASRAVRPGGLFTRGISERQTIHLPDAQNQDEFPGAAAEFVLVLRVGQMDRLSQNQDEFPGAAAVAKEQGFRTLLCVPLVRQGAG